MSITGAKSHLWQIPLLVCLGTACAGGGAWALASGQWVLGVGLWILILGCAFGASESEPEKGSHNSEFDHRSSQAAATKSVAKRPELVTKVLWRCQLAAKPGSATDVDLLVLTSNGIDLVSSASEAWERLGNQNLSAAMTSKFVSDAIAGSRSWRDLADIELCRFDAFVDEHGYDAVAKATESKVSFSQDSIAFAGIYQRRFVSSYYFEVEMFDGTTDRRDLIADDDRLDSLRNLLSDIGYPRRFRETVQVA